MSLVSEYSYYIIIFVIIIVIFGVYSIDNVYISYTENFSRKLITDKTPCWEVYQTVVRRRESNRQRLTRSDVEETIHIAGNRPAIYIYQDIYILMYILCMDIYIYTIYIHIIQIYFIVDIYQAMSNMYRLYTYLSY